MIINKGELMQILKPKDVAKILNVTVRTLQEWDATGVLPAKRLKTNRRYYTKEQIDEFLGETKTTGSTVIYARVSSRGQKQDLVNQIEFLKTYANSKGYIVEEAISDIGSGLNYNRVNWNKLLIKVREGLIKNIIVSHKDRFIRFGFDWYEDFLKSYGCSIEVVHNEKMSPNEELVQDLVSIIHVFSSRIYGLRTYKNKIANEMLNKTQELFDEEDENENSATTKCDYQQE